MYETEYLLPSLTTTDKSLSLHCTLVNTRLNKWTFRCSKSKSRRQVTLTRGKSRLQARFLGMKPKVCCRPLLLQTKSNLIHRTLVNTRPNKWTFRCSKSKSSRQVTLTRGKSRLQARFLGMKPKVCCRPLLHQTKSNLHHYWTE